MVFFKVEGLKRNWPHSLGFIYNYNPPQDFDKITNLTSYFQNLHKDPYKKKKTIFTKEKIQIQVGASATSNKVAKPLIVLLQFLY